MMEKVGRLGQSATFLSNDQRVREIEVSTGY